MYDFAPLVRPLIEHSHTVYFAYHLAQRQVLYVSPAYTELTGRQPEAVTRELPRLLASIHPDDREFLRAQVGLLLQDEPLVEDVEVRMRRADGRRQWLSLTIGRSQDAAGELLLTGTVRDITPQKEYMRNADNFNAKKNATLEILSHDLSGPLLVMQQLAEHVADQSRVYQDPALQELLRLMRTTCQESVQLIRDFVNQEFLESASVQLNLQRIDLVAKLRTVLDGYLRAQRMLDKRIRFRHTMESLYAYVDDNKFQQIINNLLSNALKFTPDDGLIEVQITEHEGRARVSVRDTGIGIPARLQPLLFDKFTRARREGLRGERTVGLGMSVIRTLVLLHEGHVWFDSIEGEGSTFYIELPLVPTEAAVEHRAISQ